MRILFMGTAPFAVPSLERLMAAGHEILGVITQPDKPVGRKRDLLPSPVKVAAMEHGLPVYQPAWLRRDKGLLEAIRTMEPDLVAYAAYGQIIPQTFLDIPREGCWNVHGSLLPKYRGAAPIQWSIINGDATTGVTIMRAEAGLDTGPILAQREMEIRRDDTWGTLAERMAGIGADLLVETIAAFERGDVAARAQDDAAATLAPSIGKDDARLDWSRTAAELDRFVRGMNPKPGAWTTWRGQDFKVWMARPVEAFSPGETGRIQMNGGSVRVDTGAGVLELLTVQPSGKKPMPAGAWAHGLRGTERFE